MNLFYKIGVLNKKAHKTCHEETFLITGDDHLVKFHMVIENELFTYEKDTVKVINFRYYNWEIE